MSKAPISDDPASMGIFEPHALAAMAQDKLDSARPQTTAQKQSAARNEEKEARLQAKEARLAGGKPLPGGKPAPPPPPPPPPEPVRIDRGLCLDKIEAYRKRFPGLRKRNNVSGKSSDEEIIDELHYIEMQLGANDQSSAGHMMFLAGVNVLETTTEKSWNPLNLRLGGLTNVCRDNMDQLAPIIDELTIKYTTGMYMGPEMRLCLMVGTMCATVHAANSGNVAVANSLSRASEVVAPPKGSGDL